jgi:hypothetical protein
VHKIFSSSLILGGASGAAAVQCTKNSGWGPQGSWMTMGSHMGLWGASGTVCDHGGPRGPQVAWGGRRPLKAAGGLGGLQGSMWLCRASGGLGWPNANYF